MSDGFFVADLPADVAAGDTVVLTGSEARHAGVVRRLRVGERLTVTDGAGRGVRGAVASLGREAVEVRVDEVLVEPEGRPRITVVQALPKNDRVAQAIDLMTEVGVDAIVPWQAARSVVKWAGERAEASRAKWEIIARESSKQARRLRFPHIGPLATTADVAGLIASSPCALVMHEAATVPLAAADLSGASDLLIVIGPEGGLTPEEVDAFARAGGITYSLGPTVLRTSTAGAVAAVQARTLWQCDRGTVLLSHRGVLT